MKVGHAIIDFLMLNFRTFQGLIFLSSFFEDFSGPVGSLEPCVCLTLEEKSVAAVA